MHIVLAQECNILTFSMVWWFLSDGDLPQKWIFSVACKYVGTRTALAWYFLCVSRDNCNDSSVSSVQSLNVLFLYLDKVSWSLSFICVMLKGSEVLQNSQHVRGISPLRCNMVFADCRNVKFPLGSFLHTKILLPTCLYYSNFIWR
jgi:hypothetical protein